MKKLLILGLLLALTGCKTNQLLAKGLKGKAVSANGAAFIAEVTPVDPVTQSPTGKILIGNIEYTSTPVGEKDKSYGYRKTVTTPVVLGLFGGSSSSTTIITGNNLKEIDAITRALNPSNITPKNRRNQHGSTKNQKQK